MKNVLENWPKEGCCKTLNQILIDFLIKRFGDTRGGTIKKVAEGVAWNNNSFWYLKSFHLSSKKRYEFSDLIHLLIIKAEEKNMKQPIVGKWYTSKRWADLSFVKLGELQHIKEGKPPYFRVHFKESISGKYIFNSLSNYWTVDSLDQLIEVSIEDIKVFLPEHNSDLLELKMHKSISKENECKWYKREDMSSTTSSMAIWFVKGIKDEIDRKTDIIYYERINRDGRYLKIKGCYSLPLMIECDVQEVQRYLPEEHEDKIKKETRTPYIEKEDDTMKYKFKVGDKVLYENGKEEIIAIVNNGEFCYVINNRKYGWRGEHRRDLEIIAGKLDAQYNFLVTEKDLQLIESSESKINVKQLNSNENGCNNTGRTVNPVKVRTVNFSVIIGKPQRGISVTGAGSQVTCRIIYSKNEFGTNKSTVKIKRS